MLRRNFLSVFSAFFMSLAPKEEVAPEKELVAPKMLIPFDKARFALIEIGEFSLINVDFVHKAIVDRLEVAEEYKQAFIDQYINLNKNGGFRKLCIDASRIWCAIEVCFLLNMDGFLLFGINLDEEIQNRNGLLNWFAKNDPNTLFYVRMQNRYNWASTLGRPPVSCRSIYQTNGRFNEMQTFKMD